MKRQQCTYRRGISAVSQADLQHWEELDLRQGTMYSLLQGLLTSRSQLSAQTCTCGPSVNRVMRGHKITVLHQLEDLALAVLEVARQPYTYSKKKHLP